MRIFLMALLCLTIGFGARAADPYQTLESIPIFAFGGVGVAGTFSSGELALRELAKSKSAMKDLKRLLKSGNIQAKCYALAALHKLSPEVFTQEVAKLREDRSEVNYAAGCMLGKFSVAEIVHNIEAGYYDGDILKK